jgi:hypothetical protein
MIDAVSCHHRSWNKARSPQKHVQQILLALLLLSHILAAPTVFIYVQNNIMLQPKEACALYSKQKKQQPVHAVTRRPGNMKHN